MKTHGEKPHPGYIHHQDSSIVEKIREIVFGMQDGMVSTLGAVTGVAVGSGDIFIVLLAGIAIISVESISMGIGSYTSSRSEKKLIERMLDEECEEIRNHHDYEVAELKDFFKKDGWSDEMASAMTKEASGNRNLMLREMAYRELQVSPDSLEHPAENGLFMFVAYIVGGSIPLSAYFFVPIESAIQVSVAITLLGLFALGALISKYTKEKWYKTGAHMFLFGSIALSVGYLVGVFSQNLAI
jgi:VIT1/CCC1 family predicted Fe2+/Mn2+ transporter